MEVEPGRETPLIDNALVGLALVAGETIYVGLGLQVIMGSE